MWDTGIVLSKSVLLGLFCVEVENELAPRHRGGVAARGGWTCSNLLITRITQIERELPYTDS
jgi:hypothetical protein